jgi:Protein of unknown function (DUF1236)
MMTRPMLVSVAIAALVASTSLVTAQTPSSSGPPGGQGQLQDRNVGASASLTAEQRARIHEAIAAQKVEPAKNLNIQVSVGAIVPKSATLHPLPESTVQIQPAWRGHMYLLVGDEILIVEPRSLRVVALLPG